MDREITPRELWYVWLAYVEYKTPYVAPSTVVRDYAKFEKRILKMMKERPDIKDARDMRAWLLENFSLETVRRTVQQFNAACKFAVAMDELPFNPFDGLTRYWGKRRQVAEGNYTAFTPDERSAIIAAFEQDDPYYADWVKFLFLSGCRPEEASALRWSDVRANFDEILIDKALPVDTRIEQPTKTYRSTRFPCNTQMKQFLKDLWFKQADESWDLGTHDGWLLPSVKGGPFDYKNFQSRHWKPLVEKLVRDRKVAFYFSEYHARHTFITELVKKGIDEQDISYICRTSVAMIQRCYASQSRNVTVPEI
ncbi:tyrosine-type recombinase/integrase [Leptolyngbya cf. ectocarpi LEGE 11479]|uniref:Tyrosine-type recombinase/integrase n=1 Tax=Leptolyngbya cf. ectocarpi LEGE 11479 TaxID=1828722 RepID=A0A928WZI0_LEPEC|nr:tyrosine-type recombinase/integrase [Leptolyngbya ectocarpi]MBE9065150.1 tyrosine-type recombinase/integrase [Leptolyngbya cf. ectocarpi LEGE 11479]